MNAKLGEVDGKARRAANKTGIPTVGRLQTKRENSRADSIRIT